MELFRHRAISPELLAEIRRHHFTTRRLAHEGVSGSYRSAFRGTGLEFEEVREYTPGDDIRAIDWKVTARSRKPFIKSFREERELLVMLCVDVSSSLDTGTRGQLRSSMVASVGAFLSMLALRNNDKVGLCTFSNRIETYHPARKARGSVWRILHEVLAAQEEHVVAGTGAVQRQTDFRGMFRFLMQVLKRPAVVFVISDFIGLEDQREVSALARKHDITALCLADPVDVTLPNAGLLGIEDSESGATCILDTSSAAFRKLYEDAARERREKMYAYFRQHAVNSITLWTHKPFLPPLRRYFELREKRRNMVVTVR